MSNVAVIGLGFGDEGKGLVTSYLSSILKDPMVYRFNGGHQAGHTVNYNGTRHVFSSFGSGTLQGVPTYWSKNCTYCPVTVMNEHKTLIAKGISPDIKTLFISPDSPVTTPWDVLAGRIINNSHGTVGVGFGQTLQRQQDNYNLVAKDILYPEIFKIKMDMIENYYKSNSKFDYSTKYCKTLPLFDIFYEAIEYARTMAHKVCVPWTDNIIFEGAQGVMLDQTHGFFPHVTRSNTTCKNIIDTGMPLGEVYYVTRTYQTRHGNGPMVGDKGPVVLKNAELETNKNHQYQGEFRISKLNPEMLNYALDCDSKNLDWKTKKNLVITCNDQLEIDVDELLDSKLTTKFNKVFLSYGDSYDKIIQYR